MIFFFRVMRPSSAAPTERRCHGYLRFHSPRTVMLKLLSTCECTVHLLQSYRRYSSTALDTDVTAPTLEGAAVKTCSDGRSVSCTSTSVIWRADSELTPGQNGVKHLQSDFYTPKWLFLLARQKPGGNETPHCRWHHEYFDFHRKSLWGAVCAHNIR